MREEVTLNSSAVTWSAIALTIPVASAALFLIGFFDYAAFPTLFGSLLCPPYAILIVVANLANILLSLRVTRTPAEPTWFADSLGVAHILSFAYLSLHVVITAFFVGLGLQC